MSTTIFCTFEQEDLADLAMGRIRRIDGVHSIRYIDDHSNVRRARSAENSRGGAFGFGSWYASAGDVPSMPCNVKITCDGSARSQVVSALINHHAYKIVTSP